MHAFHWFLKHWRGEYGMARSLLAHTLIPLLLVIWVFGVWRVHLLDNYVTLMQETASSVFMVTFTAALMIWGLVGTWRSATAHVQRSGKRVLAWSVKALLMVCFLPQIPSLVQALGTLGLMVQTTTSFSRNPGTVAIDEAAQQLRISGAIDDGTTAEAFALLRRASSPVKTVVLNSPGGLVREGDYLADLIRRQRLSVRVEHECNGVCAIALLAGKQRTAAPGAEICLAGSRSDVQADLVTPARRAYETARLSSDLLARLAAVSESRALCPPIKQLAEHGVLSEGSSS